VAAAKDAFPTWSELGPTVRADWLDKIASGIEKRMEELIDIESYDTGKPIKYIYLKFFPNSPILIFLVST